MNAKCVILMAVLMMLFAAMLCSCQRNKRPASTLNTVDMSRFKVTLESRNTDVGLNGNADQDELLDDDGTGDDNIDSKLGSATEEKKDSKKDNSKNDSKNDSKKEETSSDTRTLGENSGTGTVTPTSPSTGSSSNKNNDKKDDKKDNKEEEDDEIAAYTVGDVVVRTGDNDKAESNVRELKEKMVEEKYLVYMPTINEYIMGIKRTDYGVSVMISVIEEETFEEYVKELKSKGFTRNIKKDGLSFYGETQNGMFAKLVVEKSQTVMSIYDNEKHFG